MATSGQPVKSCKDVQAGDKTAADGLYILQAKDNGQWFSVPAFCFGMKTTEPLEYVDVDSRLNRASFVSDGPTASATCRPARATVMSWSRVRWYPDRGLLDLCDKRYANYELGAYNTDLAVQSLGSSYSCSLTSTAPRNASIDLASTAFELDTTNPNTAYWGSGDPARVTIAQETKTSINIASMAYPGEVYATSHQTRRCNIGTGNDAGCYVDSPLRDADTLVGLSECGSYGSLNNNSISKPRALKIRIKAGTTPFTALPPGPSSSATPSTSASSLPERKDGGGSSSMPIGVIVGIVVGLLLACLVAAAVIWKIRKSRRNPEARRHSKSIYSAAPAAASAHDPPSPVTNPAGASNVGAMSPVLPLALGHTALSVGRSDEYIGPASPHGDAALRRAITTVAWTSQMDNATPPPYLADGAAGQQNDYGAVNEKSIVLQQFVAEQPGELDLAVGDHVLVTHFGDGWSSGKLLRTNEWGHFPTAYVRSNSA
ncbi:hypothetical protein HDU89_002801 [Geranomyces variabilis]|nr:hypothetical protein HDU89_002801 [Geranomyces variabilis]